LAEFLPVEEKYGLRSHHHRRISIISAEDIKVILDQLNKEQKMINNLGSKLKANSQQPTANNFQYSKGRRSR